MKGAFEFLDMERYEHKDRPYFLAVSLITVLAGYSLELAVCYEDTVRHQCLLFEVCNSHENFTKHMQIISKVNSSVQVTQETAKPKHQEDAYWRDVNSEQVVICIVHTPNFTHMRTDNELFPL